MAIYNVVGYRKVDFTGKDGKQIKGISLFCGQPITQNGEGAATEKFWLTPNLLDDTGYEPALGDEVNISFNKYGKVDFIRLV